MEVLLPNDSMVGETPPQSNLRDRIVDLRANDARVQPFSIEEVEAALDKLESKKTQGPDNMQSEVLRKIKYLIFPQLTSLYNEYLEQGRVSTIWKQTYVVIKKSDDQDASYRPICLLDNLGKEFEQLLCTRLNRHRDEEEGMHAGQYAYRRGKSM